MMKRKYIIFTTLLTTIFLLAGCGKVSGPDLNTSKLESEISSSAINEPTEPESVQTETQQISQFDYSLVPEYSGNPYIEINDNKPYFTDDEKSAGTSSFENYCDLDSMGRCGTAYASVGQDIMPTEKRGEIGMIKPSGWHTVKYDCIADKYLYNRCHLIGYQLTGENANEKNLITGTRYLNVEGMLPYENMITDYVKETDNHVLYRVTPIFVKNELVARGVLMEAYSVEDSGAGVSFNIFCYNVQPGVTIDYQTGESEENDSADISSETISSTENQQETDSEYIVNTNSKKFHTTDCGNAASIADKNKEVTNKSRDELISEGYAPAKCCNP